jgi:hypothetical protein
MAMMDGTPIGNLADFRAALQDPEPYPFYAVILYTAKNSADQAVREYVRSHWYEIDALTGRDCLVFVLENRDDQAIENFRPQDVYLIAEHLGVDKATVPGVVFFTDPRERPEFVALRFRELLADGVSDDELTALLRDVADVLARCSPLPADKRLAALRRAFANAWPEGSGWADRTERTGSLVATGVVRGGSIAVALTNILAFIAQVVR